MERTYSAVAKHSLTQVLGYSIRGPEGTQWWVSFKRWKQFGSTGLFHPATISLPTTHIWFVMGDVARLAGEKWYIATKTITFQPQWRLIFIWSFYTAWHTVCLQAACSKGYPLPVVCFHCPVYLEAIWNGSLTVTACVSKAKNVELYHIKDICTSTIRQTREPDYTSEVCLKVCFQHCRKSARNDKWLILHFSAMPPTVHFSNICCLECSDTVAKVPLNICRQRLAKLQYTINVSHIWYPSFHT